MNAKNAAELLAQPDVDGGLIGGASLKAADFAECRLASSAARTRWLTVWSVSPKYWRRSLCPITT